MFYKVDFGLGCRSGSKQAKKRFRIQSTTNTEKGGGGRYHHDALKQGQIFSWKETDRGTTIG
jgi:hypothetical protein